MSLVNYAAREITCKIVYYGPGRSGKTSNLHYVYDQVPGDRRDPDDQRNARGPQAVSTRPRQREAGRES